MGDIQSDIETDRGGSVTTAEAHQDLRDPTADERAKGGGAGAGVESGGPPTTTERTNGPTGPDIVIEGTIGI